MQFLQIILVLLSWLWFGCLSDIPNPTTYWFDQKLDHFNPQELRTFKQRYLVYDGVWDGVGPIFFYAGNEGPIDSFWNATGLMFDLAPSFNALVVFAEHRYYGETLPFGDDSFTSTNLRYLTIELAIGDYALFMHSFQQEYNAEQSPVVVFGGSYGGVLAALCRIHYPAIFDMALAASAPIPQTLDLISPYVFFQLVTLDYEKIDSRCPTLVRQGYAQLIELADNKDYTTIQKVFNLCTKPTDDYDITYLELWARNGFLTMAMGDYPYSTDFLGLLPAWPVNASCFAMLEYLDDPLQALAAGAGLYYNASSNNELTCFNITDEYIECADQTGCGLGNDATAWDYQMCTEIIYGMDTNNITDMFPPRIWELGNLTSYCLETYGTSPNPLWMQIWFPAELGNITSKIIFSNGYLDPWHGGGYLESLSPELPAVIIQDGAHHLDLRESNPADPQDVINARKEEQKYIRQWLQEIQSSQSKKTVKKVVTKRLRI